MKKKLEALAEEMINEIKDLKDLTKKEIPEVAKEYVNFNLTTSLIFGTLASLMFITGTSFWIYGLTHGGDMNNNSTETGFMFGGFLMLLVGGGLSGLFWYTYLEFKLMPRRKAIEAITELF